MKNYCNFVAGHLVPVLLVWSIRASRGSLRPRASPPAPSGRRSSRQRHRERSSCSVNFHVICCVIRFRSLAGGIGISGGGARVGRQLGHVGRDALDAQRPRAAAHARAAGADSHPRCLCFL